MVYRSYQCHTTHADCSNHMLQVVMAPATRFYLDFPQEPHPMERGYYWAARYIALLRAYAFRPINYYANIDGPK